MKPYPDIPPPTGQLTLATAEKLIELIFSDQPTTPEELQGWVSELPDEIKQKLLRRYEHLEMYEHCAVIRGTMG